MSAERAGSGGSAPAGAATAMQVGAALLTVYVLWGSTYLAMRIGVATIPPFTMAAMRHFTAGVLLYAFARLRGAPRPRPEHWRSTAIVGLLLLVLGNGGVVWAEQRVSSGMAALLICIEPMWIVLFLWLLPGGRRPSARVAVGLLVGFAGLVLLVRPGAGSAAGGAVVDRLGAAALLVASIAWAAGSLYVQRAELPASPLLTTAMQMLTGGAILFVVGTVTGEPARMAAASISTASWLAVLYLVVFGSLIGFTAYTWLLRSASPVLVSTYAYVNPVVAVFLGWALLSEPITAATVTGAAVILSGVALISSASHSTPPRRDTAPSSAAPAASAASAASGTPPAEIEVHASG